MSRPRKTRKALKRAADISTQSHAEVRTALPTPLAPWRQWLFRLLALTLIPVLCVTGFELALRLFQYGYPTRFFLQHRIGNQKVMVQNDQFGRRFFPRRLVRRPAPVVFPARKPEGTYRIFVFGESAAMGDPEPSFSMSRILEVLLRERFPGTQFEVINVAFTAINSHVILPIARECARQQGDLWVIYMGNNEVVGPFGPATVFGGQSQNLSLIRAHIALKQWRATQLFEDLYLRIRPDAQGSNSWAGLQMFAQNRIGQDDPRMTKVYSYFKRNLEDILEAGRRSGAKVILSTVASNLKDFAPFASAHSRAVTSDWEKSYQEGVQAESAGRFPEAIGSYLKAAAIDSSFADLQFRLGRCYWAQQDSVQAGKRFELAKDLDALRVRADSRLNAITELAARDQASRSIHLVDANEALARKCPDGIPGDEFFFDHVHLTFEGNYALSLALAGEAATLLPSSVTRTDTRQWIGPELCARRLAFTGWNQYQMYDAMQRRLSEAPFTNQSNHSVRQRRYQAKLADLRPMLQPDALEQAAGILREALSQAPEDFYLHENFAKLLHTRGDLDGAIAEAKQVLRLLPHNPTAYYGVGNLLQAQSSSAEAGDYFSQALRRRPEFPEAHNGLGQALAKQGKTAEAIASFTRAIRLKPDYTDALLNLGEAWEKAGELDKAQQTFSEALQIQPSSFSVRLHMGNLLTKRGKLLEATKHLAEAVRLQPESVMPHITATVRLEPENPIAHFHLANALAAQNKQAEAFSSLQEAIRLKPDFWEARYLLGVELAVQGKMHEAQEQFSAVVKIEPNFALAHLNLGVALAKQSRLNEAAAQFQETLRLDPTNQPAQRHLQTIQALANPRR